jgi:SSS family solute:Na+ symporter
LTLQLGLLLGYCALQVGVGLWIGRRVSTTADFFVAGRSLGPGLLFATMLAANIGAGSTVGAAGLGYRDGLAAWWWVGSAGIGSLVLAFSVGPRMRRVARERGLQTVGDFLEDRYGRTVRALLALLLWIGTLAILAGQLIALAWVLNVVAGIPKWAGCLIGGLVASAYFSAGGLITSVSVNALQLVVMFAGFAIGLPMVIARAGGFAALVARTAGQPEFWSPWQSGPSGVAYLALLGPAFVVSPGLLQKIYGARDDRAVRFGVAGNALVLLAFAFVPPCFGIAARALHPGLDQPELALPSVLMNDLPPWLGGLGLAAVVSAEISTADAILFMLSTSLSRDLYGRFLRPDASDDQILRVARGAALLGGGAGVTLAILSPSVIGTLSLFYSILSVCLFVPIVAGLYARRAGAPEVWAAMAAGVTALVSSELSPGDHRPLALTPVLVGLLTSGAAFLVVALARRRAGSLAPTDGAPPPARPTWVEGRSADTGAEPSSPRGTSASPRRPRPRER